MSDLHETARRGSPARACDRRAVVAGMAALLASAWPGGRASAIPMAPLRVGEATVETASDGTLSSSLAFMLPEAPRAEVDDVFRAEGQPAEASPIPTNASLVRVGGEVILIDAGSGNSFQPTAGKLGESLEGRGVPRETITRVVFTHAHPDHLWGAVDDFDDSERFPNARYVVPAAEWDFWTRDDVETLVPDWLKGLAAGSRRTLRRLEAKMERRTPGETIAPGLTYVATPGHTPGHASVLVEAGREQVLIGGDALSHAVVSFRRPAWAFGSDLDRDLAIRTRRALLDRLANERLTLVGFHLPGSGIGRVERSRGAYRFMPA
ncbi:MBL fold metallo-hydrolase [Methylorubrum zatmanii]|jgi:glyoxylase-like metal-dependent hydrolase (beta-lactamase superfamily II)|uniref:MBL fold metallo-hydrolase n=1 Tax=Methylorubrum zatmanii TaxID=29429 RepID=A0ABW1WL52_9HYPH|nr:MBL fold metallo-hydrolase [Methylorubrum zatmanii]MBD8908382.1 MBL fold metallo-hydrolase [Methylorubrum zatmanii]